MIVVDMPRDQAVNPPRSWTGTYPHLVLMIGERVPLSGHTTLRLGGPAARLAEMQTAEELVDAVRRADATGEPVLVLGGGSNLVVSDDGFPGTALRVATTGITVREAGEQVLITVAAGENWDQLVEWSVAEKLAGLECLAGIPGLAGATPIQNVGAYGQEVAATITTVTALDRASASVTTLAGADCHFGYRTSLFKRTAWPQPQSGQGKGMTAAAGPTGRYVVLDVTFALERDPMSVPVSYAELAARLGVVRGERAPLADVRAAVLELRRSKGMVLDPADPDTVSAGSFFTNPVLSPGELARLERVVSARMPGMRVPTYPAQAPTRAPAAVPASARAQASPVGQSPDGYVKVPAAWLIEQAGFGKGYQGRGAARISSKHTLALTNAGGGSATDLIELAKQIAAGVRSAFGIELAHEPVLVGLTL
jgi:UDP-N-acetylmuramate dehydrogenase